MNLRNDGSGVAIAPRRTEQRETVALADGFAAEDQVARHAMKEVRGSPEQL